MLIPSSEGSFKLGISSPSDASFCRTRSSFFLKINQSGEASDKPVSLVAGVNSLGVLKIIAAYYFLVDTHN